MNKYKALAYLTGIIYCSSACCSTIRDNIVFISLDSANPSIVLKSVSVGAITATSGQPTDGATYQNHNQDNHPYISIDIRSGRHGSHDPVNKLQQDGFNVSHQDGNNFNFMAPFSFDVEIYNSTYTCGNLAFSQEDNGGSNRWSLYAKSIDLNTGKVNGVGDYINQFSDHDLKVTCLSQNDLLYYKNLKLYTSGKFASNQFYISTSNIH